MKYICDRCHKKYKHKNDYNRHINRKHSCKQFCKQFVKKSNGFKCTHCHNIYSSKNYLNRHINSYCKVLKDLGKISGKIQEIQKDTDICIEYIDNIEDDTVIVVEKNSEHLKLSKNDILISKNDRNISKIDNVNNRGTFNNNCKY